MATPVTCSIRLDHLVSASHAANYDGEYSLGSKHRQGLVERLCRKVDELPGCVYVVTALKNEWLAIAFADPVGVQMHDAFPEAPHDLGTFKIGIDLFEFLRQFCAGATSRSFWRRNGGAGPIHTAMCSGTLFGVRAGNEDPFDRHVAEQPGAKGVPGASAG